MKIFTIFILILLIDSFAFAQNPWVTAGAGAGKDQCFAVTTDNYGNSYITGWFLSTSIDFGNGITMPNNGGNYDYFLVKYDSAGNALLGKYGGGSLTDRGDGIAIDAFGNIIVTGSFFGTATFDGQTLISPYNLDAFTIKYTPTGTLDWIRQGTSWSQVKSLETGVDSSGNYIIAGYFGSSSTDTVNFSGTTINGNGNRDVFVVKYNSAGNVLWGVNAGGIESGDEAHGLVIDNADNIFITGNFKGIASFGTTNLTSAGDYDIFIAKVNPGDGSFAWAVSAGGSGLDKGYDIDMDENGNLYICGTVDDTSYFNGTQLISTGGSGNDIFIAKYDNTGNFQWVVSGGGVSTDYGYGIGVDPIGNATITGYITDQADFGTTSLTAYGGKDIFLAKYDSDGNLLNAVNVGGTDTDYGYDVKVDNRGNTYSTGYFSLDGYFGFDTLTSAGNNDVFLMKTLGEQNFEGIIVINEIMYNPLESGTDTTEFLEFYNTSTSPVDLSGFSITAGVVFTFPQGVSIGAEDFVIVAGDSAGFRNYYGFDADYVWTSGALSNSGELITLTDAGGIIIDSVDYDDYNPWPTDPDGNGSSLELMDPFLDNSLAANWQASFIIGGTPGAQNSRPPSVVPPTNLNAFTIGDTAVLIWELAATQVKSFNVFRGPSSNNLTLLSNVDSTTFIFLDSTAPVDSTYYYGVSAIYDTVESDTTIIEYYHPLLLSISEARIDNDNDYIPDRIGEIITVKGIVTSPNFGSATDYTIEDMSAGIQLYTSSFGALLNIGDEVYITGEIDQYRGKTEIVPNDSFNVHVISIGNTLPDTQLVTIPNVSEDVESELILLENVYVINPAIWPTPGNDGNVNITDGIDTLILRVDRDTDLDDSPAPTYNFNVIGVCDQFTYSTPANDGYQIKPRFYSDLNEYVNEDIYTITTPELTTAVTNEGTVGMLNSNGGSPGFTWLSSNYLYEGALMFGMGTDHVVDGARARVGGSQAQLDADFQFLSNINVIVDNADSTVLETSFDDSRTNLPPLADDGPNIPIGLEIDQTTYSYTDTANSGYVIYKLEITNISGSQLDGIVAGAYFDWDVDGATYLDNTGAVTFENVQIPGINGGNAYDAEFSYIWNATTASFGYVGTVPLSQNYFLASRITDQPTEVYGLMTEVNKFNYISERRATDPYGPGGGSDDKAIFFGFGGGSGGSGTVPDTGYTIPDNGTITVGFALVGGDDMADFVQNGKAAMQKWADLGNDIIVFEFVTSIEDEIPGIPAEFALHQNYPNPFNPITTIKYDLKQNTDVLIKVYDLLGREVRTVVDKNQTAGYKKVVWDGKNNSGQKVSTGVYFYKIVAGDFVKTMKMILIK